MFNSAARVITEAFQSRDFYGPYKFKKIYPALYDKGQPKQIEMQVKKIINTIRELSVLCVTLQYKNHYSKPGELQAEIEQQLVNVYTGREFQALNIYGLVKVISSILYQIEPNHLEELRPLTSDETNALEFLRELKAAAALNIVEKLPQYESAGAWSI